MLQVFLHSVFGVSRREQCLRILFAALFAAGFLIGDNFRDTGVFFANFRGATQVVVQFATFVGYFLAAYIAICLLTVGVSYVRSNYSATTTIKKRLPVFTVFVLAWLPYVICNFPGSVPHDTMFQFNQALGTEPYSNHHPAALTFLYGLVLKFARAVGVGDMGGIFILAILQLVFLAFAITELVRFVDKTAQCRPLTIGTVVFFALYPIWGMMVQGVTKDTPYTAFFILYVLAYARIVCAGNTDARRSSSKGASETSEIWPYAILVITALGMTFCRNSGIYIVALSSAALLFLRQRAGMKKRVIASLTVVLAVFFVITGPLYSISGVAPGSVKEALSIPLQQVARYVANYDGEITLSEKETIEAVIDYDAAKNNYNPKLSDNVKKTFKPDATEEDMQKFAHLYVTFLNRHPGVFIEAPLHNTYNYYYFADFDNTRRDFLNYTEFEINTSLDYFDYPPFTQNTRPVIANWAHALTTLPVLRLLNRCGFYTWILLLCIYSALVRRKTQEIVVALPLLLTVLVCIASPVNGMHRYMWPVMATVFILVAFVFAHRSSLQPEA